MCSYICTIYLIQTASRYFIFEYIVVSQGSELDPRSRSGSSSSAGRGAAQDLHKSSSDTVVGAERKDHLAAVTSVHTHK